MIFRTLLDKQFEEKRSEFLNFEHAQQDSLVVYLQKIARLERTPIDVIRTMLAVTSEPGAVPSAEISENGSFAVNFDQKWNNHEEARAWAAEILAERTTFAVDGSQIPPTRDYSITVAAVQIGWFENPHSADRRYEKDVDFFIMPPNELMPSPEEARVSERRICEEVRKTREFLRKKQGWKERGERMPLAFYDNTLVVPFPLSTNGKKNEYVDQMKELIELSEHTEVPLVGYIARSLSRDLLTMLDVFDLQETDRDLMHDEDLLFENVLKTWGDRTCFCIAKRQGLEDAFGDSVGFVYLQSTGDSAPARVDLPSWIYAAGLVNEVLDVVRAECVVGIGYPYALESADQMSLISVQDRDVFYRALQEFAESNEMKFTVSRKTASKGRRR